MAETAVAVAILRQAQDEDRGYPIDFVAAPSRETELTPLIRPAAAADLRAIAAVIDRAVRISNAPDYGLAERQAVLADYALPALQRRLDKAELFLVAEMPGMDRGPVGVISGSQGPHPSRERTLLIDTMFVDPSVQGMGLGGALLDDCVTRARRLDYPACTVSASLTAVPFYAHMGFSRLSSGRTARGVDTVLMERALR